MTATPHNGKEEDFQLFLALLDGDRFEGKFRDGVHQVEVSDLMRRMVKENLLKFDGTAALSRAHRVHGPLQALRRRGAPLQGGHRVRARGVQPRRGARRTTSARARSASRSPSCSGAWPRRRRRSTSRCAVGASAWRSGCASWNSCSAAPRRPHRVLAGPVLDADDVEDLEEAPENEVEAAEEEILDQATAAATLSRS